MTQSTAHGPTAAYDWDRYEDDFRPSKAYAAQEEALSEVFTDLIPIPKAVLEVGPGLGRITRYLASNWPLAKLALFDISEAAIEKTSEAIPSVDFAYGVGRIQDTVDWVEVFPFAAPLAFDLVVAVEVMLHIPPQEVEFAARNLLSAVRRGAYLVTCDWTEPLAGDRPVRVQNYRHDYVKLFRYIGASVIESRPVGLQTIFVAQP